MACMELRYCSALRPHSIRRNPLGFCAAWHLPDSHHGRRRIGLRFEPDQRDRRLGGIGIERVPLHRRWVRAFRRGNVRRRSQRTLDVFRAAQTSNWKVCVGEFLGGRNCRSGRVNSGCIWSIAERRSTFHDLSGVCAMVSLAVWASIRVNWADRHEIGTCDSAGDLHKCVQWVPARCRGFPMRKRLLHSPNRKVHGRAPCGGSHAACCCHAHSTHGGPYRRERVQRDARSPP
mmetsp:Transcript_32647/g.100979  ORF Transcript_32647/g.100979 Transcript_32647/m.100979 type:complete len:232 (-) Transcript_32647:3637-4332(-)